MYVLLLTQTQSEALRNSAAHGQLTGLKGKMSALSIIPETPGYAGLQKTPATAHVAE
jgi:hypothetical protein